MFRTIMILRCSLQISFFDESIDKTSGVHNVPTLGWDTIKSRFDLTKLGKPGESLFIFIV